MPKRIGLEIGTNKTKIVVGNYSKNKFEVQKYEIIDTVDGVFSIDEDIDILKMEFPIRDALYRMNIKTGMLYVSINNEKVIIRTRELPRVSQKEMFEVVRFEAENFLPYNIEEFYIDYKVLNEVDEEQMGESKKETFFNVMIIAAPKDIVNQYITLAERLKLKLKLTTVYTEATSKFFANKLLKDEKNVLFVDVGHSYTNMVMYQGFSYFANIRTDLGIKGIEKRLIDNHGFHLDDVKHHLYTVTNTKENILSEPKDRLEVLKNLMHDSEDIGVNKLHQLQKKLEKIKKVKNTFDAPVSELIKKRNAEYLILIKEISRMIEFFKSRKYGTFVDSIYVFGGGAFLADFIAVLEEEIGIKSEIIPTESYHSIIDKDRFEMMIPAIGACIGGKS